MLHSIQSPRSSLPLLGGMLNACFGRWRQASSIDACRQASDHPKILSSVLACVCVVAVRRTEKGVSTLLNHDDDLYVVYADTKTTAKDGKQQLHQLCLPLAYSLVLVYLWPVSIVNIIIILAATAVVFAVDSLLHLTTTTTTKEVVI